MPFLFFFQKMPEFEMSVYPAFDIHNCVYVKIWSVSLNRTAAGETHKWMENPKDSDEVSTSCMYRAAENVIYY